MKVYISKYALTLGILERDGEPSENRPDMIRVRMEYYHGEGREWHRTKEDAVRRANEMRVAKIASMKKKMAKLEKMEW